MKAPKIDERLEAQASRYALDALSAEETREFEAALRADPRLRQLVKELRGTADIRGGPLSRVAPPSPLPESIQAAADADRAAQPAGVIASDAAAQPGWMALVPWAIAACFALLCVVLVATGQKLREQAVALNDQVSERVADVAELRRQLDEFQARADNRMSNEALRLVQTEQRAVQRIDELTRQFAAATNQFAREQETLKRDLGTFRERAAQLGREKAILEDALNGTTLANNQRLASAKVSVLRPTEVAARALGAVVWLPTDQRGVLAIDGLPLLQPTQDYQLWLIDSNAAGPVSAGTLVVDAAGSVRSEFPAAANVRGVERFAVTIEPKGGGPRPAGRIVLASN